MYDFCPHCGGDIGQEQVAGQVLTCKHCGRQIGVVAPAPEKVVVDQAEELVRSGKAAHCPLCRQLIEVRPQGPARVFVPHYTAPPQRRICPGSGKPVAGPPAEAPPAPPRKTPGGKDLSAYMTRDRIKVVSCRRDADPRIEELTLEYLDRSDRVRLQIEALRDILGPAFRMRDYPQALNRPYLAVWASADACVVGKRHPQGGYQTMTDAEVAQVVADLRQHRQSFFAGGASV